MTVLDSSVIIDMLNGVESTVGAVETYGEPYLTSTVCVYEVVAGKLGTGTTDVAAARADFGGIQALDLTETITLEAARLQDELLADGEAMAPRDLFVAATALSTGDALLVADEDFATGVLESRLDVRNLRDT